MAVIVPTVTSAGICLLADTSPAISLRLDQNCLARGRVEEVEPCWVEDERILVPAMRPARGFTRATLPPLTRECLRSGLRRPRPTHPRRRSWGIRREVDKQLRAKRFDELNLAYEARRLGRSELF